MASSEQELIIDAAVGLKASTGRGAGNLRKSSATAAYEI